MRGWRRERGGREEAEGGEGADEQRSGGWRREKEEGERVEEGLHLLVTIITHICWA